MIRRLKHSLGFQRLFGFWQISKGQIEVSKLMMVMTDVFIQRIFLFSRHKVARKGIVSVFLFNLVEFLICSELCRQNVMFIENQKLRTWYGHEEKTSINTLGNSSNVVASKLAPRCYISGWPCSCAVYRHDSLITQIYIATVIILLTGTALQQLPIAQFNKTSQLPPPTHTTAEHPHTPAGVIIP